MEKIRKRKRKRVLMKRNSTGKIPEAAGRWKRAGVTEHRWRGRGAGLRLEREAGAWRWAGSSRKVRGGPIHLLVLRTVSGSN